MELSLFLAQLFGLSIVVVAVGMLVKPTMLQDVMKDMNHSPMLNMMFGFLGILGGLAIILSHNVWSQDWRVVITIFGWGAFIKGSLFMFAPDALKNIGVSMYGSEKRTRVVLILLLAVGLYLSAVGFGYW